MTAATASLALLLIRPLKLQPYLITSFYYLYLFQGRTLQGGGGGSDGAGQSAPSKGYTMLNTAKNYFVYKT